MGRSIPVTPEHLLTHLGQSRWPRVIDVRRPRAYEEARDVVARAVWRDHRLAVQWEERYRAVNWVVVYCEHGEQVSQSAAAVLCSIGINASFLIGGIDAWRTCGGVTIAKDSLSATRGDVPSHWVTRQRPKIDRVACPWMVRRFIDPDAVFHFVSSTWVKAIALEMGAIPFDVPDTPFSHVGELCSFDAFLSHYRIVDPVLESLARIVRGADTARLDLAPQCAGLLAMSLGLSAAYPDDLEMLERGMILYDALYAWLRFASDETHTWSQPASDR